MGSPHTRWCHPAWRNLSERRSGSGWAAGVACDMLLLVRHQILFNVSFKLPTVSWRFTLNGPSRSPDTSEMKTSKRRQWHFSLARRFLSCQIFTLCIHFSNSRMALEPKWRLEPKWCLEPKWRLEPIGMASWTKMATDMYYTRSMLTMCTY